MTGGQAGTGAGGAGGGTPTDICKLPMVSGPCDALFRAWWHNPATGVCEPFIYGGCQGNANNFPSLEACQKACHGGTPDMDTCEGPGSCFLASLGCCGVCDGDAEARSFVAVNRAYSKAYPTAAGCASGTTCGQCPPVSEMKSTRQYFRAECSAGNCIVVDIRTSDLTACSTVQDCVLRDGIECCEGCDGGGIVAINRKVDIGKQICGTPMPCLACAPNIPSSYSAACTNSHCSVAYGP